MYANGMALSFFLRPPLLLPQVQRRDGRSSTQGQERRWQRGVERHFVVSGAQHGLASGGHDRRPRQAEDERAAAAVDGGGGDWGVFFGTTQHDPTSTESRARPYRGARQHKQTGIRPSRARCACLKYMYQNKPAPHLPFSFLYLHYCSLYFLF